MDRIKIACSLLQFALPLSLFAAEVTDIGTHRELFVEDTLIETISGNARLELHHPEAREIAL